MRTGNVVRAPQIHNKSNEPILNHMNERQTVTNGSFKENVQSSDYIGFL